MALRLGLHGELFCELGTPPPGIVFAEELAKQLGFRTPSCAVTAAGTIGWSEQPGVP